MLWARQRPRELGANIIVPYIPIPGHGALGVFADPTGATCAVWEPSAAPAEKKAATKKAAKKTSKKVPKKRR